MFGVHTHVLPQYSSQTFPAIQFSALLWPVNLQLSHSPTLGLCLIIIIVNCYHRLDSVHIMNGTWIISILFSLFTICILIGCNNSICDINIYVILWPVLNGITMTRSPVEILFRALLFVVDTTCLFHDPLWHHNRQWCC